MDKTKHQTQSHQSHDHPAGGSCCGGDTGKTKAPADRAKPAASDHAKHKPEGKSGCCS